MEDALTFALRSCDFHSLKSMRCLTIDRNAQLRLKRAGWMVFLSRLEVCSSRWSPPPFLLDCIQLAYGSSSCSQMSSLNHSVGYPHIPNVAGTAIHRFPLAHQRPSTHYAPPQINYSATIDRKRQHYHHFPFSWWRLGVGEWVSTRVSSHYVCQDSETLVLIPSSDCHGFVAKKALGLPIVFGQHFYRAVVADCRPWKHSFPSWLFLIIFSHS